MSILFVFLLCAIYYVAGTVFDIVLELTMVHFGFEAYTGIGHVIVVLAWPILFIWLIFALFVGFIRGTIAAIIIWRKRNK